MEHRGAKGQTDVKAPDHLKPIIKQANQWRWSFNATEQSIASLWVWFDVFEPSGVEVMPVHFCVLFFCFALRQISEIHVTGESEDMTAKERLLLWSKQTTEGYVGVRCENFTTSWRDGRLFNALIHKYRYYNKHTHNTACFCRTIVLLVFFWFIQKMQLIWTSLLEFIFIPLVALSLQYYTVSTYLCLFLLQTGPCGHEPCVNTDQPIKFRRRILCSWTAGGGQTTGSWG